MFSLFWIYLQNLFFVFSLFLHSREKSLKHPNSNLSIDRSITVYIYIYIYIYIYVVSNFESSIKLSFQQNSWFFFQLVWLGRISVVDFRLILLLLLGKLLDYLKYLSAVHVACDETHLLAIFPCLYSLVPEFVLRVPIVVFNKIVGGSFLVPYCLGLLLPFPAGQIKCRTWSVWFFLRNKFL